MEISHLHIPKDIAEVIRVTAQREAGIPLRPSEADISTTTGGGSDAAALSLDLSRKIPRLEPATFRRFIQNAKIFIRFLQNTRPDLLPVAAKPQILTKQLCLWLEDRIAQYELTKKKTITVGAVNEGEQPHTKLAATTLISYRVTAERLLWYAAPPFTPAELEAQKKILHTHTFQLIQNHQLARNRMPPEVMGPSEVRIILEHLIERNHQLTEMNLQLCLLVLILLLSGVRPGTLLSSPAYPATYLTWDDITMGPARDGQGRIIGIIVTIIFKNFKGYRYKTKYTLKYIIEPL